MESLQTADAIFRQLGLRVFERGWLSSNNVLFAASRLAPATIVDTGYDTHVEQTLALLDTALGGAALERIVNTHLHSDHCGANAAIQRRWNSEVWIHEPALEAAAGWDEQRLTYRATGQRCDRFQASRAVADGESLALGPYRWFVASARGHDADAMVLFQPESGVAMTGDALWQDRVAITFSALDGEGGFADALASLDLIEQLAPRIVIPGHGVPFSDAGEAVRRSRERLRQFERDPRRHLDYAERALVMFHMLERRQRPLDELRQWLLETPVFRKIGENRGRSAAEQAEDADRAIGSLVAGGQLQQRGAVVSVER